MASNWNFQGDRPTSDTHHADYHDSLAGLGTQFERTHLPDRNDQAGSSGLSGLNFDVADLHKTRIPDEGRVYVDDITFERERGERRLLDGVHRGHGGLKTEDNEFSPINDESFEQRRQYHQDPGNKMWTKVPKILVSKDAIEEIKYEYEESEDFYYVSKFLEYEEKSRLLELTENIKHDRRRRIRELQGERGFLHDGAPRRAIGAIHQDWDEERIVEREIVYDSGERRSHGVEGPRQDFRLSIPSKSTTNVNLQGPTATPVIQQGYDPEMMEWVQGGSDPPAQLDLGSIPDISSSISYRNNPTSLMSLRPQGGDVSDTDDMRTSPNTQSWHADVVHRSRNPSAQDMKPTNRSKTESSRKSGSGRRGPLKPEIRQRAGMVRKVGACSSCKRSKVKCGHVAPDTWIEVNDSDSSEKDGLHINPYLDITSSMNESSDPAVSSPSVQHIHADGPPQSIYPKSTNRSDLRQPTGSPKIADGTLEDENSSAELARISSDSSSMVTFVGDDGQFCATATKHRIMDRAMAIVYATIHTRLESLFKDCPSGQLKNPTPGRRTAKRNSQYRRSTSKRSSIRTFSPSEEEENGFKRRRTRDQAAASEQENRKWLACPFNKYNRFFYCVNDTTGLRYRTCADRGFETIHRLKQHLRKGPHRPADQCARCGQIFRSRDSLNAHAQQLQPCTRRTFPANGDVSPEKTELIMGTHGIQWEKIYEILFPGSTPIPSPYVESVIDVACSGPIPLEQYIRVGVPSLVEASLRPMIDQFSQQHFQADIENKVAEAIEMTLREYHNSFAPLPAASAVGTGSFEPSFDDFEQEIATAPLQPHDLVEEIETPLPGLTDDGADGAGFQSEGTSFPETIDPALLQLPDWEMHQEEKDCRCFCHSTSHDYSELCWDCCNTTEDA